MNKDEKFVKEIKDYIIKKAKLEFGYAGLAEGEKFIMLNTGKGNITIKINME
jgi:hypothetical protein